MYQSLVEETKTMEGNGWGNLQVLGPLEAPPLGRGWRLPLAQGRSSQSHSQCMHAKRGEGAQGRKNYLLQQPQNSWRNCLPLPWCPYHQRGYMRKLRECGVWELFPLPVHTPQAHGWQKGLCGCVEGPDCEGPGPFPLPHEDLGRGP